MLKRILIGAALAAFAIAAFVGVSSTQNRAEARVFIGFGFGGPCCGYYPYYPDPYWYYPPPYYGYYGPPAVFEPPPTNLAPSRGYSSAPELNTNTPPSGPPPMANAGPPPRNMRPPQAVWYYCENPSGYYPYVKKCGTRWRQVAARPEM